MSLKHRFYIFLSSFMFGFLGLHVLGTFMFYVLSIIAFIYFILGIKGGRKHV